MSRPDRDARWFASVTGTPLAKVVQMDSRARIATLKAQSAAPGVCSSEIPQAPARGRLESFRDIEVVMTPSGSRTRYRSEAGDRAARAADVFDRMQAAATGRKPDAPPLFTPGQILSARTYAALTERCASSGMRSVSMEMRTDSGPTGGEFIDAVIRDSRALEKFFEAIGPGYALVARGALAQADRGRRSLPVRVLVDRVCLGQLGLAPILKDHGWAPTGRCVGMAREALCGALDRMSQVLPG